jgi:hypothetical protein
MSAIKNDPSAWRRQGRGLVVCSGEHDDGAKGQGHADIGSDLSLLNRRPGFGVGATSLGAMTAAPSFYALQAPSCSMLFLTHGSTACGGLPATAGFRT